MSALRLISFWPPTGFPDHPWLEHPDEDAFVRSARSVCELYSEAICRTRVPARHSELRLACHHDSDRTNILVTVHPEITEGFELAVALLPPGIAELPAPVRGGLVLEVVHAAVTRLGQDRGWEEAALLAARDHVLAAGLRYRWTGPAKVSPDRRHIAHPVYVLQDDGYGRVTVQVRRRDDGQLVAESPPALAFSTSAGFARSARTLHWRSKRVVEMVPYAGLSAGLGRTVLWRNDQGLITIDLDDLATLALPPDHPLDEGPDTVAVQARVPAVVVQTPAELGPHIRVVGGGPTNDVPDVYLVTLNGLLEQLREPRWRRWWSAGEHKVLEVRYDFAADSTGIAARRSGDNLRVTIRRPASTFATGRDPATLARDDVDAVLTTIRRRAGLGPHPPLN
ncbi:hypothetical protein KRM28CT15_17500 [Krasilnikovia sp. M28-CT-15]